MIEAVVFDFGHTLVDFALNQELLLAAHHEALCLLAGSLAPAILSAAEQVDGVTQRVEWRIEESRVRQDLHELDSVAAFSSFSGSSRPAVPESLVHQVACLERRALRAETHLSPANAQTLRDLRSAGFRLGLVSRVGMRGDWLRALFDDLGVLEQLDAVALSSEESMATPDPRLYQVVLDRLGIEGRSAVFVGDRIDEDVAESQAVGMRAVLTRQFRREEPGSPLAGPDAIIDRLADLPAAIGALLAAVAV